jgi:hypothetical protein
MIPRIPPMAKIALMVVTTLDSHSGLSSVVAQSSCLTEVESSISHFIMRAITNGRTAEMQLEARVSVLCLR